MTHTVLVCTACGATETRVPRLSVCTTCEAPLDVRYTSPAPSSGASEGRLPGIWSRRDRLPLHDPSHIVSLDEGHTPLVPLKRGGQRLGLSRLYAKVEYLNPTGSFKDRGTSVLVSMAREEGLTELVEDSSGNAGASLAAYCARAGIRAIVFVPASAPRHKTDQIRYYGADLRPVPGDRQAVAEAAQQYVRKSGAFYGSHNLSPYFSQGMKSFAYELGEELPSAQHIVLPVGNGSLLLGSYHGFRELVQADTVGQAPRLHCVQARACQPIVAQFLGQPWSFEHARPTIAGGIAVSRPPRGDQVAQAVRDTDGSATSVAEEDIVRWHRLLAREEGLFVEPTSATAFAGLEDLVRRGVIGADEVTVVPLTGFGLKDAIPGE